MLQESEQFRQSVTGCFSSCTASLGIFLQAERGFFWALCCSPGIHPSITNRESRAARGREQPHPWMLVEKGYHTHGDAGIDPDHPAVTRRVPCSPLLLCTVFLSPNPWGFVAMLVEIPLSLSYTLPLHHKKWLKYQGTPHGATETTGACQDGVREEGKTKKASGECGCWAAQAGPGSQAGALVMVICNSDPVLCLSAAPGCPAHGWEQLGFCTPATKE